MSSSGSTSSECFSLKPRAGDDGGKAGLRAEQQCTKTHLLAMQRELLQMMADGQNCFLK